MPHNSNAITSVKGNRASDLRKHGGKGSYKQREMTKLDIDNKQMEWRLHQLKQTMEEEKKGRSQVGNIWESASTRALNIPTKAPSKVNINNKTGKVRPKTEGNRKVTVLKDEPLELPKRKSNYTTLIEKLSKEDQSLEQYTSKPGTVAQSESKQAWIPIAKNRNSEEILDIQSDPDGNLPLSSIKTINPNAIGLFFIKWGRKRILPAVDDKVVRPKAGWGTDTYYPYVSAISWEQQQKTPAVNFNLKNEPQAPKTPQSPRPQKKNYQEVEQPKTGGLLFQGEFNEEESAESFQRALQQWRKDSKTAAAPPGTPRAGAEKKSMSVHSVQSDPIEIQVNFSETSTLTASEKQMLEKHRSSAVPPLPASFTSDLQRGDNLVDDLDMFHELSAEVLEERERIRDIFSSSLLPKSYLGGLASSISFTEVNDDEPAVDGQTSKCIVEVPDENKDKVDARPSSRVTIQEFDYSLENKLEEEITDTDTQTQASPNPIFECKNENSKSLLSAVSSLSIDPKAVYNHRNLENFFTGGEDSMNSPREIQEDNEQAPTSQMMTKTHSNAQSWQPSTSVVSSLRERKIERLDSFETHDFEEKQSYKLEEFKTLEEIERVIEREKDDQEHLKKLEWELASQTGNVDKEGRISRRIDEWPSDDDDSKLGIINDPGTSSGLTTPDVDRFKWADHLPVVGPSSPAADEDVTIRKPWSSPGNARFQHIENYMIGGIDDSDDEL